MKIFAKQIAPEYQESPLMIFDEWPEDLAVCGNRDYKEHTPEVFKRVYEALENGELCEALEDIESGNGYYSEWYKNATEAINDLLAPEKEKYSTRDIHSIKTLVAEYSTCHRSEEDAILCKVLSVVTGKEWDSRTIRGCCQSDWNDIFYIVENWSKEALEVFEMEYFNTGTEWIVHDEAEDPESPEDINGYSMYCYGWNADKIREEIAEQAGGKPEDVILYGFEGYYNTPIYKEVV